MASAMTAITNSGVRDAAGLLVRRGWAAADPAFEICAHGACGRDGPR